MVDCNLQLNATDACSLARATCSEVGKGVFGSYIVAWHCELGGLVATLPLLVAWLLVLIYALGTTADIFLVPQLNYLSAFFKLSPDVAGVTLLAFGNGAPDVFTGLAVAARGGEDVDFSLLLSDLVGGSVFIMTVVLGAVVWIAHHYAPGWRIDPLPFWRDCLSLIVALSTVAAVTADGAVHLWEAFGLLALYILYICLVLTLPLLLRCFEVPSADSQDQAHSTAANGKGAGVAASSDERRGLIPAPPSVMGTAAPLAGLDWEGDVSLLEKALWSASLPLAVLRWASIPSSDGLWDARRRRWTAATPPLAALFILLLARGDLTAAAAARVGGSALPVGALLLPLGLLGSAALWHSTRSGVPPHGIAALVAAGFLMTVVWLNLLANEMARPQPRSGQNWRPARAPAPARAPLPQQPRCAHRTPPPSPCTQVALVEAFGVMLGISTSILGLTVIAVGNSVGDLVADACAARGADARMALAACFGSPLLMNILGIGLSLSLRLLIDGGAPVRSVVSLQCRLAYAVLCCALLAHLVAFPSGGYRAPRAYAAGLWSLYALFLLLGCLSEAGAVNLDFLCGSSWPCPEETSTIYANRIYRLATVLGPQAGDEI